MKMLLIQKHARQTSLVWNVKPLTKPLRTKMVLISCVLKALKTIVHKNCFDIMIYCSIHPSFDIIAGDYFRECEVSSAQHLCHSNKSQMQTCRGYGCNDCNRVLRYSSLRMGTCWYESGLVGLRVLLDGSMWEVECRGDVQIAKVDQLPHLAARRSIVVADQSAPRTIENK